MLKRNTILSTILDKYCIEKQIGQGGNGTVFCAKNSEGKEFAIKVIDRAGTTKDKLKRFVNELTFCQNNRHTGIIEVLDSGALEHEQLDIIFCVMPLYPYTLRDKMQENLTAEEKISIFIKLISALEYVHTEGIWHRDVKPENILMDHDDNVVLTDFGIAHFSNEHLIAAVETKNNERLANFQYCAPEQKTRGSVVNGAADIFAGGLILNELFTGKIISGSSYTKISDVDDEWRFLDKLVDEMIAQNPGQRLFPASKVLFQLEVFDNEHRAKVELERLSKSQKEGSLEPIPEVAPKVIGADYDNGKFIIKLDRVMPLEWCNLLINGQFAKSFLNNYIPQNFKMQNGDEFFIFMRTSEEQNMQRVLEHFKTWLAPVTQGYNQKMNSDYMRREQKMQQERKQALEKAQNELRIKEKVRVLV